MGIYKKIKDKKASLLVNTIIGISILSFAYVSTSMLINGINTNQDKNEDLQQLMDTVENFNNEVKTTDYKLLMDTYNNKTFNNYNGEYTLKTRVVSDEPCDSDTGVCDMYLVKADVYDKNGNYLTTTEANRAFLHYKTRKTPSKAGYVVQMVVPANATLYYKLWGAGGGAGGNDDLSHVGWGSPGGGGGYAEGTYKPSQDTTIEVLSGAQGQRGRDIIYEAWNTGASPGLYGGAGGSGPGYSSGSGGSGGGASMIKLMDGTYIAVAGGGGGGAGGANWVPSTIAGSSYGSFRTNTNQGGYGSGAGCDGSGGGGGGGGHYGGNGGRYSCDNSGYWNGAWGGSYGSSYDYTLGDSSSVGPGECISKDGHKVCNPYTAYYSDNAMDGYPANQYDVDRGNHGLGGYNHHGPTGSPTDGVALVYYYLESSAYL